MDVASPVRRTRSPRAVILGVVVAAMLFSSVYPLGRYFAVRADVAQLRQQERDLNDRIGDLMSESESLRSRGEIELLARGELGFVRPGEVPFVVVPRARAGRPERAQDDPAPAPS